MGMCRYIQKYTDIVKEYRVHDSTVHTNTDRYKMAKLGTN
jgi:hypothetical protein